MYATTENMIAAFGEADVVAITDRAGNGAVDEAVLEAALAAASSEADSYIGRRYALPLGTVPAALTSVVCDIARYRLTGNMAMETDPIRERYKLAIAWLEDIAAGRAELPGQDIDGAGGEDDAAVDFAPGRRVFAGGGSEDA